MSGVTKGTVDGAIHSLNSKAEELGLRRRFSMRYGSSTNGVQHTLLEEDPALTHPTETKIGKTLAETYAYVLAMNHAFLSAIQDRKMQRSQALSGMDAMVAGLLPTRGTFADPDARSARRAGEGV